MLPPSSSFSTSKTSPPPPPPQTPLFLPITEIEDQQEEEEQHIHTTEDKTKKMSPYQHTPTPLHPTTTTTTINIKHSNHRKRPESKDTDPDDRTVSCNKCRPTSRDKISVVPFGIHINKSSPSNPSPNGIFRSILSTLTKKSPRSSYCDSSSSATKDEQWKLAVSELSHKLIQTTRKRDEALLEASRLKFSMTELEKKLNKLEIYCHELKNGLDVCTTNSPYRISNDLSPTILKRTVHHDEVIESFINSVSEARSSVRVLSRSLTIQLRQMGVKIYEKISMLLQPYDVNISFSKNNPRSLLFYLEALLNRVFYEDFEGTGFMKNGSVLILNPIEKCKSNYESFTVLQGLSWDEVLSKGTRHFSEEFSRFCDRKMSEIVAMLSWNRAWPEPLLQAFFGAAKSVWLVHLLACSVHPSFPIFRVDKDVRFAGVYMEDMGGDKARKLVPDVVRIMVAPGFYVYNNVIKCKVICRYSNTRESTTLEGGGVQYKS